MKKSVKKKTIVESPVPAESATTITIPKLPVTRTQLFIALCVLLVGAAIYAITTGFTKTRMLSQSSAQASRQTETLIVKVGRLIELPKGESPRIATITDPAKLASQPFFQDAKAGDQVLIYDKAQRIILYRPSTNKIIQTSSLKGEGGTAAQKTVVEPTQSPQTTPSPLRITVLNGTETPGLAAATADKVTRQFSYVKIVTTGNTEGSYTDTIVVDLTGKRKSGAQEIATYLKGRVGALPQGEIKPSDTDIVIIITD